MRAVFFEDKKCAECKKDLLSIKPLIKMLNISFEIRDVADAGFKDFHSSKYKMLPMAIYEDKTSSAYWFGAITDLEKFIKERKAEK